MTEYFDQLGTDLEAVSYACYFAELAEYYTRENVDESQMLNLLYVSIKALLAGWVPRPLVRRIFEMRAHGDQRRISPDFHLHEMRGGTRGGDLQQNAQGDSLSSLPKNTGGGTLSGAGGASRPAICGCGTSAEALPFYAEGRSFREMEQVVSAGLSAFVDKKFHSLKVLEALQNEKNPVK